MKSRKLRAPVALLGLALAIASLLAAEAGAMGGVKPPATLGTGWKTNFSKRLVPFSEFRSGGPGKDGIPAIDRPRFTSVSKADFLDPAEPVIELAVAGRARAYPIQILIWHEIVNDRVAGVPVAVTFCPLCNTAIVFDRRVAKRTLSFGVSGNLRNADLVMYDRQTESWWQQFGGRALVGDLAGARLRKLPARMTSWDDFRIAHPDGQVLTRETGHERRYGDNPYAGYDRADTPPFFPVENLDDTRLLPKDRVVLIESGKEAVVVPHSALSRKRTIELRLAGKTYVVRARGKLNSPLDNEALPFGRSIPSVDVRVDGKPVPFEEPFWFAVAAFLPNARIVR